MFVLKRLSGDPPQKRPISQPTLPTSFDSRAIRSVLLQKRQFEKGRAFNSLEAGCASFAPPSNDAIGERSDQQTVHFNED